MNLKKSLYFLAAVAGTMALDFGINGFQNQVGAADNSQTITVDADKTIRPAEHVASGGLVALKDGTTPSANLASALHPKVYTQVVDGAHQISNGQSSPGGYFSDVAPTAHKAGAKIEIRLADYLSGWPYKFTNMDDWLKMVDKTMQTTKNSPYKNDIYGYEIFNEPNGSYESFDESNDHQPANSTGNKTPAKWGSFYTLWDKTVAHIKAVDPNAKVIGPSLYKWDSTWMKNFLAHCKKTTVTVNGKKVSVMPDYIAWHIGNDGKDVEASAKALAQIEQELGISTKIPININEYGTRDELAVPGNMVHYMQSFENIPNLDSACMSYWFNYGRLNNLLTDQQKPNGGYWLYKWYGDMDGNMVKTSTDQTPSSDLASVANANDSGKTNVIFGGKSGDTTINVNGLSSAKYTTNTAKITVSKTPWYGVDSAVSGPTVVEQGTVPVKDGKISVPVKNIETTSGYQLQVTPSSTTNSQTDLQTIQPKDTDPIHLEAEDGQLLGGVTLATASYASARQYIHHVKSTGQGVKLTFNAPKDGQYKLEIGYGRGDAKTSKATAAETLNINGTVLKDVTYQPLADGISATTNPTGTRKTVDYGNVTLKKGKNTLTLMYKNGDVQLDYAQLTLDQTTVPSGGDSSNTTTTPSSSTSSSSSSSSAATSSASSSAASSSSSPTSNSSSTHVTTPSVKVPNSAAKKGTAVYALKKLNLYKASTFKATNKIVTYAKRSRLNRPTFVVTGYAQSTNGLLRYHVRDTNRGSKTYGKTGYITAKTNYVRPLYYQSVPKSKAITVISKKGINAYKTSKLTGKVKHYKASTTLRIKKIVSVHHTTRYMLSNGHYITANKQFIIQGKH